VCRAVIKNSGRGVSVERTGGGGGRGENGPSPSCAFVGGTLKSAGRTASIDTRGEDVSGKIKRDRTPPIPGHESFKKTRSKGPNLSSISVEVT